MILMVLRSHLGTGLPNRLHRPACAPPTFCTQAVVAHMIQDFPELGTGPRKLTSADVANRKIKLFPEGE